MVRSDVSKVILSGACLSTGGRCTPPWTDTPPSGQTPPRQTPPWTDTPPWADLPLAWAGTPKTDTHPLDRHPLGRHPAPEMATAAYGTHPTHSRNTLIFCY